MNRIDLELNAQGLGSVKIDGIESLYVRSVTLKSHVGDLTEVRLECVVEPFAYHGPADVHYEMPDLVDEVVKQLTLGYRAGHDFTTLNAHVANAIDIAVNRAMDGRK